MRAIESAPGPKVSIIMPAYRTAGYIAESIDSVRRQTWANWELVIVDDGSPDDVVEVVAPFLDDPRILCRSFPNGGLATARNRGLAVASGDFVSLLDSDDLFEPDYLDRMMACFARAPETSFVTCDALMFGIPSREGRRFSQHEPQILPLTFERVLARRFNILVAATIRTADLREAGGFNPALRAAEDFDLWTRLLLKGRTGGYIAAPLVRYRRRADSLSAATATLRSHEARVYLDRLGDVPPDSEAATICRRQIKAAMAAIDMALAETAIANGDIAGASAHLREGQPNPPLRWRAMRLLMRHCPPLATRLLGQRSRWNKADLSVPPATQPREGQQVASRVRE